MKRSYSHFDLPTLHYGGPEHYVPPRTRDADERARRHSLPPGTLLAEQQYAGLRVAEGIMAHDLDEDDMAFASLLLAASELNSSWYSFARDHANEVMRRRLELPRLVDEETTLRETREGLLHKTRAGLATAAQWAGVLAEATAENTRHAKLPVLTGRTMGNSSLQLACVTIGNVPYGISAFEVQARARQQGLEALALSRRTVAEVGVLPSVAQLADVDSPLSVFWRRHAPDGAYDALEAATASLASYR